MRYRGLSTDFRWKALYFVENPLIQAHISSNSRVMENEIKIRRHIVEICRRLYDKNMLASADGNVSYRLSDERILITPSGLPKAFISVEDIAVINLKGEKLSGNASSEMMMHLEVYKNCPEAKSVVHAHPPYSVAWTIAEPELKELPAECMSELILAVGFIPIVPFARPGTLAMGKNLRPFLNQTRVMILARHGALTWGESLDEAYMGMERLEHSAQILTHAKSMGGLTYLGESDV